MKKVQNARTSLLHYGTLAMGAAILAFGMFNIHSRSMITEGGVLGMTLLIQRWFHISPGITGLILDITCYFLGYKMLGKDFLKNAIIASCCFSLFYNIFEAFPPILPNLSGSPLLAAVLGGMFVGVGVGLVVRAGGASGGDDALALVITKVTGWKIARSYLLTDMIVLCLSLTYISYTRILYSLITVTMSSFIIGKIHGGGEASEISNELAKE